MSGDFDAARVNVAAPSEVDVRLRPPFTALVCGSTGAGKTTFVKNLLRNMNHICDRPAGKTYFFYKEYQQGYEQMQNVELVQGMPTMEWCANKFRDRIGGSERGDEDAANRPVPTVVVDDQGRNIGEDSIQLFTVASHHYDINLLWLTHTLFGRNPAHRTMSLNSKYLVIFKNPRDKLEVMSLAKQVDPNRASRFVNIFMEATRKPHSYLLTDFDQNTPESHRLRSNILFERGEPMPIYVREQ